MRLIEAEQMKQIVDEYIEETGVDVFTVYHIHDFLDECDAVDAEPVKHGRWISQNTGRTHFACSNCHKGNFGGYEKYCPHCGAKMDLEGE